MKLFQQMRNLVKKVPKGRVTTYGAIAKALEIRNSRLVGWAMHGNKDPSVPCHRVVFKDGSLAPSYAFGPAPLNRSLSRVRIEQKERQGFVGGAKVQKEKLVKEGVKFIQDKVNLKNHFWKP